MMSTVYEVMTPNVVTISPDQSVESAARIMANHGISSIIVYDEAQPVGIVTEKDILTRIVAVGHDPREVTVAKIMTNGVVTCSSDTTIEEACKTMRLKNIKKLAVIENDALAGIVSLTDIANKQPELNEILNQENTGPDFIEDILQLMNQSEGQRLEFKPSLRYDLHTRQVNQNLEGAVLKTICAFLNSEGGTVLMGLSEDKTVTGIEKDYMVIGHQNRDGFENHLLGLISSSIGNSYLPCIETTFHNVLGKDLCQVNVQPSPKPAFLNNGDKQCFYVRAGNTSRPFSISEASEYIQEKWG